MVNLMGALFHCHQRILLHRSFLLSHMERTRKIYFCSHSSSMCHLSVSHWQNILCRRTIGLLLLKLLLMANFFYNKGFRSPHRDNWQQNSIHLKSLGKLKVNHTLDPGQQETIHQFLFLCKSNSQIESSHQLGLKMETLTN